MQFIVQLELMFMKHYVPNRCLYIKVAKLRTGVGSAEMSHLQNCKIGVGSGGVGLGGQGGCERRIEVFGKIHQKNSGGGGVGRGGGQVGGGRVGGGGGGSGWM